MFIRLKIPIDKDKEVNIKQLEQYQEAMKALIQPKIKKQFHMCNGLYFTVHV